MSDKISFDYNSFVVANAGSNFSKIDYIHAIYSLQKLPADFAVSISSFFWPEFKFTDGMVFLLEVFDREKYQNMLDKGCEIKEICFWMNLLEITDLFESLSYEQAKFVAKKIESSWSAKLKLESNSSLFFAKSILDESAEEVFLTIDVRD